jgi:hypothetical protein
VVEPRCRPLTTSSHVAAGYPRPLLATVFLLHPLSPTSLTRRNGRRWSLTTTSHRRTSTRRPATAEARAATTSELVPPTPCFIPVPTLAHLRPELEDEESNPIWRSDSFLWKYRKGPGTDNWIQFLFQFRLRSVGSVLVAPGRSRNT